MVAIPVYMRKVTGSTTYSQLIFDAKKHWGGMDNKAETIGMVEFKIKVIENFSSF
jgi:hypothetical protein